MKIICVAIVHNHYQKLGSNILFVGILEAKQGESCQGGLRYQSQPSHGKVEVGAMSLIPLSKCLHVLVNLILLNASQVQTF